jgi:hypothetical protein
MKPALAVILTGALVMRTASVMSQADACGIAASLLSCGNVVLGNTSLFTADVASSVPCGIPNGSGGGVWYRITGTGTAITASLCGSAYDTQIRVFTGPCAGLSVRCGQQ